MECSMEATPLVLSDNEAGTCSLNSPTAMPRATAYLWNRSMMIQVNCRGYAVAQHLQPEPSKYAYGPALEAKTFMQPEQGYYAHHPGRFVYVKDEATGSLFSIPYEPVRSSADRFQFVASDRWIEWRIEQLGIAAEWRLALPEEDAVELWSLTIRNSSSSARELSIYPYFPMGYMSWMNQSGAFRPDLNAIVAKSITPYQRSEDYDRIRRRKDITFLVASERPNAWETRQEIFEGEGGLASPDGAAGLELECGEAHYERPAAVMQFRVALERGGVGRLRFAFGPARTDDEIAVVRSRYMGCNVRAADTGERQQQDVGGVQIETPDRYFDAFVNVWLPRQVRYHGELNRLTTDPQTRNYLQDAMGMSYLRPDVARTAFELAIKQQSSTGAMPDGVLLTEDAELKYINKVPHTDHNVWLPLCLQAYLQETNDYDFLGLPLRFSDSDREATVFEHVTMAVRWLLQHRDARGLSYIEQGDWCDPMNMVGIRGTGVSGWLTLATAYAARVWGAICAGLGVTSVAEELFAGAQACNWSANTHLWDGEWYARGITDDGRRFGVATDKQGQMFLNPQSWAMLSQAASLERCRSLVRQIEARLQTPYGVELVAPAFTAMQEDIGRVTQKYPGSCRKRSGL